MNSLRIVAIVLAVTVAYGVVHDEITARICVEYFTIGHPRLLHTDNPTLLGLFWGIVATWWVGLALGIALATAAQYSDRPKRTPRSLLRELLLPIAAIGCLAVLAGLFGFWAAKSGWVYLVDPMASKVPKDHQVAFLADLWTHLASYAGGFVGGAVLCWRVWRSRRTTS